MRGKGMMPDWIRLHGARAGMDVLAPTGVALLRKRPFEHTHDPGPEKIIFPNPIAPHDPG